MTSSRLDPHRRSRLLDLFAEALDLAAAQRAAFCKQACGDDEELRRELESLLAATPEPSDDDAFLATPAVAAAAELDPEDARLAASQAAGPATPDPEQIGPYRIVERLGEGGMGVVYRAEQTEPLRRTVALKVIKPGMDTARVVARFHHERQVLARMDHPGIARIHDAGTTPEGRPFFAMQLVTGEPIDAFCQRRDLTVDDRVALLARVCDAVQHAHQKGLIHRDLKPSNVLAEDRDGEFVATVIDFGIARVIADSADETLLGHTRQHEVVGTLDYMAPEQASLAADAETGVDVDSRADIYSLGVLLYQLLTGSLPFTRPSNTDLQRALLDRTPTAPSTRLDRSTPQGRERYRRLRGELDWIGMKALEPDRSRRYASASELAADLRRHLAREPVLAGPPGVWYRARAFARRHRTSVLAASFAMAGLLAGATAAVASYLNALQQRSRAEQALSTAEAAQNTAEQARSRAEESADLLIRWLRSVNLETGPDQIRPVLDRVAVQATTLFPDRPRAQAWVHRALGESYTNIGEHSAACEQFGKALRLLDERPTVRPVENYEVAYLWQWAAYGAAKYALARALDIRCAGMTQSMFVEDHPELARLLLRLRKSKFTPACGAVFEALREYATDALDPGDPRWIAVADYLADNVYQVNRTVDTSPWLDFAEDIYVGRLGLQESGARCLGMEWTRLHALKLAGRSTEVLSRGRAILARFRTVWPEHHWYVQGLRQTLADALNDLGEARAATDLYLEIERVERQRRGPGHSELPDCLRGLIIAFEKLGEPERIPEVRERLTAAVAMSPRGLSLGSLSAALGPEHRPFVTALEELTGRAGGVSVATNRVVSDPGGVPTAELRDPVDAALEMWRQAFAPEDPRAAAVAVCMRDFVSTWHNKGRSKTLILPWMDHAIDCLRKQEAPLLEDLLWWRARTYCLLGRIEESRIDIREALEVTKTIPDPSYAPSYTRLLGRCALQLGDERGLELLHEGYLGLVRSLGEAENTTSAGFNLLYSELLSQNRLEECDRLLQERFERLLLRGGGVRALRRTAQRASRLSSASNQTRDLALRAAKHAAVLAPEDWQVQSALAAALYRTGDTDRALEQINSCLSPGHDGSRGDAPLAEQHALRALLLAASGATEAALAALDEAERRAAELGESHPEQHLVREAAAQLR